MREIENSTGLVLINSSIYFTAHERTEMKHKFKSNDMEIFFLEQRSIQNSFLDGLEIILNNNLFNIIAGGLIMPATYDLLKKSLVTIVKKIRSSNILILRANKDAKPTKAIIKVKTEIGEFIAPIDQEISEDKVEEYINAFVKGYKAAKVSGNKNQYFIVDKSSDQTLEVLLLSDYLKKHNKL
ncbi:hypothetical protein [Marinilactibacillus psychrotolerans]|uniref:hypothetical protein n=1 Tax=Marinilactibacillus psychrotolerans TaxID=191770 RepID=UPI003884EFBA